MADKPTKSVEELLAIVEALDPEKRESEEQPPTDEELQEARELLAEHARKALEGDLPDIASGKTIRQAVDKIDAEKVTRAEAKEAAKAEAKALLEGLEPKAQDEGDEGKDGEGDGDKDGEGSGDDDKDGENKPPEARTDEKPADKQVAKVASLSEAIKRSNQRSEAKPKIEAVNEHVLVASTGPAQGYGLGQDAGIKDAAEVFTRFAPQVKRGSAVLIHMDKLYPEERSLGLSAEENTRLLDAVTDQRVITAAGGICEPLGADFTHPICGDRGRPIRDSLPNFSGTRGGGVRFAPSATVADLEGAITVWTEATDSEPGSATKDCPRVDCEAEDEARVDAIVACLTVGNFQARFNPEFWRSRLDLLMVAHDRIAEQTLYNTMVAAGTTTLAPADAGSGTLVDVLRVIDLQVAGLRSRHRLIGTQMRTILPAWLHNALRTALTPQAPAGSADLLDIGDARLNQFFSSRGVTPVFSPDIELIGAQAGAADLADYNTPFNVLTYPEGTYFFLDGGTLDLGTNITDSTLNAVNDRQAFMETFEQVVFRGCEALVTPVTVAEPCMCDGAA